MKRDTEKDLVPPEYALPEEAPTQRTSAYATDPGIRMPTANRELLSGVLVAQQRRKQRERLGREIAEQGALASRAPIALASIVPVERPAQREREVEEEPSDSSDRGPTPTARFRQRVTISWALLLLVPIALLVLVVVWSAAKRLWSAETATAASSPALSSTATTSAALPPRGIESMIPPPEPMPSTSASSKSAAAASSLPLPSPPSAPASARIPASHPSASATPAPSSTNKLLIKVND